jgi:hypothetical protein
MAEDEAQTTPSGLREIPALMTASWEAATTAPDPLAASRTLSGLLSTWEARLVCEAVAAGTTWEVIGGTVGVSRQAAWERFHGDVHEFVRRVKNDMNDLCTRHRQEMLDLRESIKSEAMTRRRRGA